MSTEKFCTVCLRSGDKLCSMSNNDLNYYETIITKLPVLPLGHSICVYCRQILNKFMKFIHQCHASNVYLNNTYGKIKTECIPPLNTCCNLQKSATITYTLDNEGTLNDNAVLQDNEDTSIFEDTMYSDDELPLADLSKINSDKYGEELKKTEKVTEKKKNIFDKILINLQKFTSRETSVHKKRTWITAKGTQREGFNSKMVQETDEYLVIKLTKEQVLQEMTEKSHSESYLKYTYKCEQCVKGFNYDDVLQNHMQKHIKKPGSFKCDICHQHCPSVISLRGHLKSHTTRYKCKVCEEVRLSRQHLLEHYANKHGGGAREYTCMQCQYSTDKRTVIQRHVRSHKSDRHTCHRCGNSYSTLMALRVHLKRHDGSARVICPQCGRKFITASTLKKHIVHVHERGDYYCVECDVKFQCAYNLNLHFKRAKRHRDESSYRYKCPTCPQRFVYQSELESHASRHGDEQVLACAHCDKRFITKHGLRTHCRRAHGQIKSKNKKLEHTSNEV